MSKLTSFVLSPALPAALLLYAIIFGFALWSYLGWQWRRMDTILLYSVIFLWAAGTVFNRWRRASIALNQLDILVIVFALLVLGSIATHWWDGTVQYLKYMPFFFLLPYLLGRAMRSDDINLFKSLLIGFAITLLLLMPFEYWRNSQPGFLYENSPAPILFIQGHGTMLAGLLFSAGLLALITNLIATPVSNVGLAKLGTGSPALIYLLIAALLGAMAWIASRGPAVALLFGMLALFLFSTFISWKKKLAILLAVCFAGLLAFTISFQNPHHKHYFKLLFMRPATALSAVPSNLPKLEYGKPILGAEICKNIPNSITDRWIHYRTAWEIFLAKPWTGVGANFYGFYSCTGPGWFPHSTVLQVLAELGVLGGVLYFLLIALVFRTIVSRIKSGPTVQLKSNTIWLLAFTVFQFTVSQFNSNYFMSTGLYFSIGLAASLLDTGKTIRAGA